MKTHWLRQTLSVHQPEPVVGKSKVSWINSQNHQLRGSSLQGAQSQYFNKYKYLTAMLLTSARSRCDIDFLIRAPDSKDVQLNAQSCLLLTDSHLLCTPTIYQQPALISIPQQSPRFSMKEVPTLYLQETGWFEQGYSEAFSSQQMSVEWALRAVGAWILAWQWLLMVAGLPGSGISNINSEKS